MDHYCTIDDVNAYVPQAPFSGTSVPSSVQVEKFIASVARRIDASIEGLGYTVPVVSGTNALALLRETNAWGALGLAQTVRETGVKVATNDRGQPFDNLWTAKFEQFMKRLANPQDAFELPDAPRTDQQLFKQGDDVLRSHVQSDVDRFVDNPGVTRDQVL